MNTLAMPDCADQIYKIAEWPKHPLFGIRGRHLGISTGATVHLLHADASTRMKGHSLVVGHAIRCLPCILSRILCPVVSIRKPYPMNSKTLLAISGISLAVIALSGCSANGISAASTPSASTPSASASSASAPAPSAAPAAMADAALATNSLGAVVVDGKGMTAYAFDGDAATPGKSACIAACAAIWPAITTMSTTPTVTGITGTVGTITGANGGKQITINGMPIYTFSKDVAPGDTKGEGVKGVWHALTAAGVKIPAPAAG